MWTSGGAILRDLTRAQGGGGGGRGAHGGELRALRPWDRPPPPPRWLSEETEDYVRGLAPTPPAVACEVGPDLRHIQQMLDMVRKLNIAEEKIANDEALIGKLDSFAIEHSRRIKFLGPELAGPAHTPPAAAPPPALGVVLEMQEPKKHKKRRRNIALESILQALENNKQNDAINCTSEQFTLLKPEDLITKFPENKNKSTYHKNAEDTDNTSSYDKVDSKEKVSHWMNQMMKPIQTKAQSKQAVREAITLDPSSMFKRRVKVDVAKPCSKLNCEAAFLNEKRSGNGSASYVPSGDASRCYQRYLENNKSIQTQTRRDEASLLAALITEALERAAHAEPTERAVLGESSERAAHAEPTERAVLGESSERAAHAEPTERAVLGESSKQTASVESGMARALVSAPASVRLAAPRPCLPLVPCLVCERLTRRPSPSSEPECEGRAAAQQC